MASFSFGVPYTDVCPLPFYGKTVTLTTGGVEEAFPAPFANTKEIIIYNRSIIDDVRVGIQEVYPLFPVAVANPTVIPAGGSLTLAIGPEGYRTMMGDSGFWAIGSINAGAPGTRVGTGYNLVFQGVNSDILPFDIVVTYVQSPGGGGGVTP